MSGASTMFYIRTQRGGEMVGKASSDPDLFDTRAEARGYADSIAESIPSKYGRLIVSEYTDELAYRHERERHWASAR